SAPNLAAPFDCLRIERRGMWETGLRKGYSIAGYLGRRARDTMAKPVFFASPRRARVRPFVGRLKRPLSEAPDSAPNRHNRRLGIPMSETVLIVDDDPVQRRLLEAMVSRFGYRALVAEGGDGALQLLLGADAAPI